MSPAPSVGRFSARFADRQAPLRGGSGPAASAAPGLSEVLERLLPRCSFPPAGSEVNLAVSGGADSLALLILAAAWGLRATAVHVDHGIRPGSDSDAALVAAAADRFGVRFESRAVVVTPGPDLEARAPAARYGVLPPGVLTGHTMDDQAETILLNLLRGAGLDGMCGMLRETPGGPRRPLIRLRRFETEALCKAAGVTFLDDPTNRDRRFRRNRVRSEVIPLLCDVAGRDVVPLLARQAELLAAEADLLDSLAAPIEPTKARELACAPLPLARRAVRRWLRSADGGGDAEAHPPSAAEVARVLAVASGDSTACQLAGGRRVARSAGRLRVEAPAPGDQGERAPARRARH